MQQEQALYAGASIISKALDEQIQQLDHVMEDEDELKKLRMKRLREMRQGQEDRRKWKDLGHGSVQELPDEKAFFQAVEESERVIAHFWLPDNKHADILHTHMKVLAPAHIETRFVRLNAENSPFLTNKLNITIVPSVVLVKDGKTDHTLHGLSEVSATGEYETWHLERCLANYGLLTNSAVEEQAAGNRLDLEE